MAVQSATSKPAESPKPSSSPAPAASPADPAPASESSSEPDRVELSEPASADLEPEEPAETGPPDFDKMSTDEQYDYLQQVVTEQAEGDPAAWKSGTGEVNLVGIRSFQDGRPVEGQGNAYDDTIYAVWVDETGQRQVRAFTASTDAGVVADPQSTGFGVYENGSYQGFSHLADGHYRDTWVKGSVPGSDLGLRQAGDIRIHADSDNDGVISDAERLGQDLDGDGRADGTTKGSGWGIQFHPGGSGPNVGSWSAGCQVIQAGEYADFKNILNNASNGRFSYTLVDSSALPPVDGTRAATGPAPVATDPPELPPAVQSPGDIFGFHTLTAHVEGSRGDLSAQDQLGLVQATGSRWITEASASNEIVSDTGELTDKGRALAGTIAWAAENDKNVNLRLDYSWGTNVPNDEEGRRLYAERVADFLEQLPPEQRDAIEYLVIGNEPNLTLENADQGRPTDPADYVAAVAAVRDELEARGLDVKLASAGLSPQPGHDQYFRQLMEAGLGDQVDAYGMHAYRNDLGDIARLADIAEEFGASKPMSITEFGIPRHGIGPDEQAAMTRNFIEQVLEWNADPGNPPIESVTIWHHNRGPAQDAYSVTPQMLETLGELSGGSYQPGTNPVNLNPVSGGAPPSFGGPGGQGTAPGSDVLNHLFGADPAYQRGGINELLLSNPNQALMTLAALAEQELLAGKPGSMLMLLQLVYLQALQMGAQLEDQVERRVTEVLSKGGVGQGDFGRLGQGYTDAMPFGPAPFRLPATGLVA